MKRSALKNLFLNALCCILAGWLLVACGGSTVDEDVSLQTPTGMAVGVAARDTNGASTLAYLFVANSGEKAVEVLTLASQLKSISYVSSPAQFFPLRIPIAGIPTELAATTNGELILVLDVLNESLRLIDAKTLRLVRDSNNTVIQLSLGDLGKRPSSLVASPVPCTAPCLGKFYVSLAGTGQIQTLEVQNDPATPIILGDVYDVGGAPTSLAVLSTGDWLFASDAATSQVIRLDLETSDVSRLDVGALPGTIAVSGDGNSLLVARPSQKDIVVVRDLLATWAIVDANGVFAPQPQCLDACDASPPLCDGAPLADAALCNDEGALVATANEYTGVYLGQVPSRVATLSTTLEHPELRATCSSDSAKTVSYRDFAVAVTLDGTLYLIGLSDNEGNPIAPTLLSSDSCGVTPKVEFLSEVQAADYLENCPAVPDGRARFQCNNAPAAVEPGVRFLRGFISDFTFQLQWEGILPGLNRFIGGGGVDDAGRFSDFGLDLARYPILPGDILEILTPPLATCVTSDLGGNSAACGLERRITAITVESGRTWLQLDEPLPIRCFGDRGEIAYRIRAGDVFLATLPNEIAVRLPLGTRVGPGGDIGQDQPFMLQLRADVDGDLGTNDIHPELSACDRYDFDGTPKAPMPAVLSRAKTLGFSLQDGLAPLRAGLLVDTQSDTTTAAGLLPGGMLVVTERLNKPAVFVSYAGSHRISALEPFDTSTLGSSSTFRVFR